MPVIVAPPSTAEGRIVFQIAENDPNCEITEVPGGPFGIVRGLIAVPGSGMQIVLEVDQNNQDSKIRVGNGPSDRLRAYDFRYRSPIIIDVRAAESDEAFICADIDTTTGEAAVFRVKVYTRSEYQDVLHTKQETFPLICVVDLTTIVGGSVSDADILLSGLTDLTEVYSRRDINTELRSNLGVVDTQVAARASFLIDPVSGTAEVLGGGYNVPVSGTLLGSGDLSFFSFVLPQHINSAVHPVGLFDLLHGVTAHWNIIGSNNNDLDTVVQISTTQNLDGDTLVTLKFSDGAGVSKPLTAGFTSDFYFGLTLFGTLQIP